MPVTVRNQGTSRLVRAGEAAWEDLTMPHSFAAAFGLHAGQHFSQKAPMWGVRMWKTQGRAPHV